MSSNVLHDWIFRFDTEGAALGVTYSHMVNIQKIEHQGVRLLGAAWQASSAGCEGDPGQHVRFSLSWDAGQTWGPSSCVMYGLSAVWSPILHYDEAASRLYLFYSESRKVHSPGGDIKVVESTDLGGSWSHPRTILTHEADGGVPKVLANKLTVLSSGAWVLPYWREPPDSWELYPHYHPLQHSPKPPRPAPPAGSPADVKLSSAGVLVSLDSGASWTARGSVQLASTWLIENTLVGLSPTEPSQLPRESRDFQESLLMLFRTGEGKIFASRCEDGRGEEWTPAVPTELPNPNSKTGMTKCRLPNRSGEACLALAYNHSTTKRSPLHLACSYDDGESWVQSAVLENDEQGNFAYPTPIEWEDGIVKVAYTVWNGGLRVATVNLAPSKS
eukprot:CAMPEP_0196574354 /NCGR_PEP_ID=MMETSP1081-20130531/4083_1 /TAXON_ID=36882 /ORGANISM="Pyramimonas amylifera, Strain CCMP720" /LENGTH=387 /DNA_ID=CAMNT_0041892349 /DNA_START=68 /DNA_END=1231 /DNA_ORIENTATION=+